MATAEHVICEIDLIARQFECRGAAGAASATADHVRKFWAPLLKSTLLAEARSHAERFSPIARSAIGLLE